jgi:Zn-dependent protease with chaperone function
MGLPRPSFSVLRPESEPDSLAWRPSGMTAVTRIRLELVLLGSKWGPTISCSGTVAHVVVGTLNLYLGYFFLSAIAVLFISLFVSTSRRRRRQHHTDQAKSVEFQVPPPGESNNRRVMRMRALACMGFGLWAAVLGARGEPVLGPIAAVILLEFSLVLFRSSLIVGGVVSDDVVAARVGPVVTDLCGRAKCGAPRIMLRDDFLRIAGVVRVKGRITIVLSRPFAERVSDQELTGLLAHEVVHIARGDLGGARGRAVAGVLGGYALVAVVGATLKVSLVAAFPILVAAFVVGLMITSIVLSPLSRSREARADREGARLSGDPRASARALVVADAVSQEMRTRLYGRAPWSWLLAPVTSWRRLTHPRTAKRIARLEAMA